MLKYISICAALIAFESGPLNAQPREAILETVEVPGARFSIVLAMPKSPATTINLDNSPDALVLHLDGNELVLGFEDATKMLNVHDSLKTPGCTFHVKSDDTKSQMPVIVYLVRKNSPLVVRFRHLHPAAASSRANVGIKGPLATY